MEHKKRGRPPVSDPRRVWTVRVNVSEGAAIETRAALLGLSRSEYLRACALGRAGWVPVGLVSGG